MPSIKFIATAALAAFASLAAAGTPFNIGIQRYNDTSCSQPIGQLYGHEKSCFRFSCSSAWWTTRGYVLGNGKCRALGDNPNKKKDKNNLEYGSFD